MDGNDGAAAHDHCERYDGRVSRARAERCVFCGRDTQRAAGTKTRLTCRDAACERRLLNEHNAAYHRRRASWLFGRRVSEAFCSRCFYASALCRCRGANLARRRR